MGCKLQLTLLCHLKKPKHHQKPKQPSLMFKEQHIPYRNMFSILLDRCNQILMSMKLV